MMSSKRLLSKQHELKLSKSMKDQNIVNNAESAVLHARPLEQILTWTKAHLDAYLATAEVILEQNIDPG
jgi:hypothetical protein